MIAVKLFFHQRVKKNGLKRPWALGRLKEAETSWWAEQRTRGQRCFQQPLCGTHLRLTIFKKIKLTQRSTAGHRVALASRLGKDTRAPKEEDKNNQQPLLGFRLFGATKCLFVHLLLRSAPCCPLWFPLALLQPAQHRLRDI